MATVQEQLLLEKFDLISSTITFVIVSFTTQFTLTVLRKTPQDGSKQNSAQEIAAEMSFVHNMIIRGIKSIHEQAEGVSSRGSVQDKLDFANYALAWSKFIHHHHEFEEDVAFPDANRITRVEGLMDANIEEHKVFHDGPSSGGISALLELRIGTAHSHVGG